MTGNGGKERKMRRRTYSGKHARPETPEYRERRPRGRRMPFIFRILITLVVLALVFYILLLLNPSWFRVVEFE